jgi:hypothetical protein
VLDRIKKFKLDVRRKAWLICDRDRKFNELKDQNRRHTTSRRIECFFFVVVTRDVDSDAWFLKIVNEEHNDSATLVEAHSVHRKLVMIDEIKSEIFKALAVQTWSSQVLFSLRILDSMIEINIDDSKNPRIINSLFKSRDIYNVKTQLRRETLRSLTSMQISFFNEIFESLSLRVSLNM